jgi:hypothetical protein
MVYNILDYSLLTLFTGWYYKEYNISETDLFPSSREKVVLLEYWTLGKVQNSRSPEC